MKNILSYNGTKQFTGQEIKEWIRYHIENQTSKTKYAKHMINFLNIKDDEYYDVFCDRYQHKEDIFIVRRRKAISK